MPDTPLELLSTGIPGLDHIAGGGLPAGAVTLLAGTAGTGKTVLASQFLAAGIARGEPGVFVAIEEPLDKVRRFVGTFGWDVAAWEAAGTWAFVDASLGDDFEIVVGGDLDLTALVSRIAAAVTSIGARRIVLDPLSAIFARLGDGLRVRAELHRVVSALEALDVTTLVTVEREHDYDGISRFGVEEFVADNVVILRNALEHERRRRTVEAFKLRGVAHQTGEHPYEILSERGVVIAALSAFDLDNIATERRTSIGNPGIDAMCGGGLYAGSTTLVSGPTGTGKTLLAIDFAAAEATGRTLYIALEESPSQLARAARHRGHDLDAMQADGRLRIEARYPEAVPIARHLIALQQAVEEFRPARLVIDSVSAVERYAQEREFHEFLLGLTALARTDGITTLLTTTTESLVGGESATGVEASTLLDTIVLLRYVEVYGEIHRGIAVLKVRGSDHEKAIREFVIDERGLVVGGPFRTTTGLLAGGNLQLLGDERQRVETLYAERAPDGGC